MQQQQQWQQQAQRRSTCHGTPPQHRRTRSQRSSRCRAAQHHQHYQAADDPVVSTAWLQDHLDEVALLDVRGRVDSAEAAPGVERSTYLADYTSYLDGHVPGAVFWDWTKDGIDAANPVPVQLQCDADLLAAALEAKGVGSDRPVVAYDDGDGMLAARLWWLLTVAGHPNALVLEGGWAKWRSEGRPSELYEPCTLKVYASFESAMQPQLRATLDDVRQALQQQQDVSGSAAPLLLDTRNAQQFSGQVRRGPRGGRIPGAVSLPRAELLDAGGTSFKPLDQQAQLLRRAGVVLAHPGSTEQQQQQRQVICYCNGGVAAASAALALHRLGHRNWSIYDGSLNEYGASDLPVELPAGDAAT